MPRIRGPLAECDPAVVRPWLTRPPQGLCSIASIIWRLVDVELIAKVLINDVIAKLNLAPGTLPVCRPSRSWPIRLANWIGRSFETKPFFSQGVYCGLAPC